MISKLSSLLVAFLATAVLLQPAEPVAASGKTEAKAQEPGAAPPKRCRIGRRAYCFKYKGLCERDGTASCAAWFDACWSCHDAADSCRRAGGECESCRTQWSQCMAESYKTHWPAKARK